MSEDDSHGSTPKGAEIHRIGPSSDHDPRKRRSKGLPHLLRARAELAGESGPRDAAIVAENNQTLLDRALKGKEIVDARNWQERVTQKAIETEREPS